VSTYNTQQPKCLNTALFCPHVTGHYKNFGRVDQVAVTEEEDVSS
jgi:hypothetical protein